MYPDFEFLNPDDGVIVDDITVKSKRTGNTIVIEVNDKLEDNKEHYKTMIKFMEENAEPSGELRINAETGTLYFQTPLQLE